MRLATLEENGHTHGLGRGLALDVKVILTPPCTFH
jgi:hypothetical protein